MDARAVFTLTSGLLTLYSLSVVAFKVLWPWRGQARGLLARCCECSRRRTLEPEEAEVEKRVREERLRRHAERARTFLTMFSVPSTYFSFSMLWSLAVGMQAMRLLPLAVVQANLFTKSTLAFLPKLLTPKMIDAIYVQSLVTMACVTMFSGPASLASWRLVNVVQFCYWGLFDLKPWINAAGAFGLFLAEVAVVALMDAPREPLIPASMTYLGALLSLIGIDYCLERSARFEILAAESKSELTAIQTLLNSICDVVVSLDGLLRLKQHSPKLADVLLQPASRNSAGADLRDYMATDADRDVFSKHVRMKDGDTAQANVFHARLRDGARSTVAMEFFTVGFKGHSGEQHHIVGMREHTDIQPLVRQPCEPQPPPVELPTTRGSRTVDHPQPQLLGTPASAEQRALGSREGDRSDSGSDSASPSTLSAIFRTMGVGAEDLAARPTLIETSEIARIATTNYLLMSWVIGATRRSCCPMHAAISSLQRVARQLAEKDCSPDYGSAAKWQCRRCGIRADEFRDPACERRRRCVLCKDLDDTVFASTASSGAASSVAL